MKQRRILQIIPGSGIISIWEPRETSPSGFPFALHMREMRIEAWALYETNIPLFQDVIAMVRDGHCLVPVTEFEPELRTRFLKDSKEMPENEFNEKWLRGLKNDEIERVRQLVQKHL